MHSTGEKVCSSSLSSLAYEEHSIFLLKTNPVPIGVLNLVKLSSIHFEVYSSEAILLKDPRISHAVMFGRERFHSGVLVVPIPQILPTDLELLAEYRNAIWFLPFASS